MEERDFNYYKELVHSVAQGYLGLTKRAALYERSLHYAKDMEQELSSTLRYSIKTIQDTLYSSLVVEIHAWLLDPNTKTSDNRHKTESKNTNILLNKITSDPDFIKLLKQEHIKRPPTIQLTATPLSDCHFDFFTKPLESEFQTRFEELKENYKDLKSSDLEKRLRILRNKELAHKDFAFNMTEHGHRVDDVITATKQMRTIVLQLIFLFLRTNYEELIEEEEQKAQNQADTFWKHLLRI